MNTKNLAVSERNTNLVWSVTYPDFLNVTAWSGIAFKVLPLDNCGLKVAPRVMDLMCPLTPNDWTFLPS